MASGSKRKLHIITTAHCGVLNLSEPNTPPALLSTEVVRPKSAKSAKSAIRKDAFGNRVITITFGDVAENGPGMQKLGTMSREGFTLSDLTQAQAFFTERGHDTQLVRLSDALREEEKCDPVPDPAFFLIIRGGAKNADALLAEQSALVSDTQAWMRGRVVTKRARHNLCFAGQAQVANYEKGQGTVVSFHNVPYLQSLRNALPEQFGPKAKDLLAEQNNYYNIAICGIGFHGDAERTKVIAVRLGSSMDMHFQWFHRNKPVGQRVTMMLHHGDMYMMSAKAVGTDWKKSSIFTLRHAAGAKKFTTI